MHDVVSQPGKPLAPDIRADMESRLGHDFQDVWVHSDGAADASARSVNANAYTVGSHIVFQRSAFHLGSHEGRKTLAHELTHVVQQRNGPVDGTPAAGGISLSDPSDRFEREAATKAEHAVAAPDSVAPAPASTQKTQQQVRENRPQKAAQQSPLPATLSRSIGNQEVAQLIAGAATPPEVTAHNHPDESAAHALASAVMRMAVPTGQQAHTHSALSEGLDSDTRSFFESRFSVDLGDVRVHTNPAAAQSAARLGAAAYTVGTDIVMGAGQQAGPNLVTAHELAHVVRGDAANRLCRTPGGSESFTIISQVWRVAGRDIVMVATGYGNQVLSFYRRVGRGYKGVGVAPPKDKWVPFKTLMEHRKRPGKPWFNKNPYYTTVEPDNPLRGYGNTRNQQVGAWLDDEQIPAGMEAQSWEKVEQEMDQVAARYRASPPGGGTPSGGSRPGGSTEPKTGSPEAKGAGTEAKAASTEAKAAGTEAKAVGTEAKALGVEAKALKGEGAALKVATDAAKAGRAARLGALLLELGLPGPWDVLFLFLSIFGSIAEAKAELKADAYALGFAEGLSAVLTGTSASDTIRLLMFKVVIPSFGERVAGFEGVREGGTNDGVAAGFKFGKALNSRTARGFLAKCFAEIKARNHHITGDFGRDDLIEMGVSLRPTVIGLLEEAQRQEADRLFYQRMAHPGRLASED